MEIVTFVIASALLLSALHLYLRAICGICTSKNRMDGKVVIVTGATSGMGKIIAKDLAKRGAKIIMPSLYLDEGYRIRDELIEETGNEKIFVYELNLASFKSIREFARQINTDEKVVDILIHNAGIADSGIKKNITEDGLEATMTVNYYGPFLLTHLLIDLLKKSAPSRIIFVASIMYLFGDLNLKARNARMGYPAHCYCSSKRATIVTAKEFARRLHGSRVTSNSIHPGVVDTEIWDDTTYPPLSWLLNLTRKMFKSPTEGAQTAIHVAVSDDVIGVTGKYFEDCHEAPLYFTVTETQVKELWELTEKCVNLQPEEKI